MSEPIDIPRSSYGILLQTSVSSAIEESVEQIKSLGYSVIDAGYDPRELGELSEEFNSTHNRYISLYGETRLRSLDELNTIRGLLTLGRNAFLRLALNQTLIAVLQQLISGHFILNQQNGVINPPLQTYNQAAWHRDLPYQHFVSTKPLAINALFCVDDFTTKNGATFVLPASHKSESFPSNSFISKHSVQVTARAGSFILLDCMTFHAGGFNTTSVPRRAINHVYSIPFFKQQINIPMNIGNTLLSDKERSLLGFDYQEPRSVAEYLAARSDKRG